MNSLPSSGVAWHEDATSPDPGQPWASAGTAPAKASHGRSNNSPLRPPPHNARILAVSDHTYSPSASMTDDAQRPTPQNVQPAEAKELIDKEYTLLDVRTPEEYALGHVPGSINVPIKLDDGAGRMVPNLDFLQQVKEHVTPDVPVVCTCAHGRRGGDAAAQLAAAGHGKIVNLAGGLAAWSDAALPHSGHIKRHH
ncbi:hypothetical protein ABPG75_006927 [Micractinium tetrahymenae]